MRQFAGFGTAEETNERFSYLLAQGQTGLSTAFDMPTLLGYDSDHPFASGEVGKLRRGHRHRWRTWRCSSTASRSDEVTTSMTINRPGLDPAAPCTWSVAEKQGVAVDQAERHHPERHPQGVHRPERPTSSRPGRRMRLVTDMIAFCARARAPVEHHLHLRLPHPRGRRDRRPGAGLHPGRRHRLRGGGRQGAGSTSTSSPRGSPSSSTSTTTSSRRSPSSAPPGASGPGVMQRALRRQEPAAPGCCASTPRPPGSA